MLDSTSPGVAAPAGWTAALARPSSALPHREEMERRFATSFAGVQAHLGTSAEVESLRAVAVASKDRIAFASSMPSRAVVAHELAHVLQFRRAGAALWPRVGVSWRGDPAEREADAAVAALADRQVPTISQAPTAHLMRLDRPSALSLLERAPVLGGSIQAASRLYESASINIEARPQPIERDSRGAEHSRHPRGRFGGSGAAQGDDVPASTSLARPQPRYAGNDRGRARRPVGQNRRDARCPGALRRGDSGAGSGQSG